LRSTKASLDSILTLPYLRNDPPWTCSPATVRSQEDVMDLLLSLSAGGS
jgi:hypothetical protein